MATAINPRSGGGQQINIPRWFELSKKVRMVLLYLDYCFYFLAFFYKLILVKTQSRDHENFLNISKF